MEGLTAFLEVSGVSFGQQFQMKPAMPIRLSESFVVLSQTLYPRILQRVKTGCNNSDFSITFREDDTGLRCFVCFFADDVIQEVCVL